jgi:predicted HTH transcriptional regulator
MAVVIVMPSDMPPVKFDGRIWVRSGPSRCLANEQDERILNEKRRYKNIPFDIYPAPSAPAHYYIGPMKGPTLRCGYIGFNDRVEINSPGGPYGNVTVENFGKLGITDYRNPNIGDALKAFGFIQAFGRGIATAEKALMENGNPPLQFEVTQSAVV